MVRKFEDLPITGEVGGNGVWPGDYWPTYEDSINKRWLSPSIPSPAEKYERAFARSGGAGFAQRIREMHGTQSVTGAYCDDATPCRDPQGEISEGDVCVKDRGARSGKCIATWTGVCHGWAPAAFMVPEPKFPVTVNGVRFEVNDIKALATMAYTDVASNLLGQRCEEILGQTSSAAIPVPCKDSNPAVLHILLTNIVGWGKKSFVVDLTYDQQVWNHPVRSFKVLSSTDVTATEATRLVTGRAGAYTINPRAVAFKKVKTELSVIVESSASVDGPLQDQLDGYTSTETYNYILELDGAGDVIGGEWIGTSVRKHPDFVWAPKGPVPNLLPDGKPYVTPEGLRPQIVHGLVYDSQRPNVVR